jgi:hypothetical protein
LDGRGTGANSAGGPQENKQKNTLRKMKTTLQSITFLALITLAGVHSLSADDAIKTYQAQRQQEHLRQQMDQLNQKSWQREIRVNDNNRAIMQRTYSVSRPSSTPAYRPSYSGRR